jgi:hypothetical protein
VCGFSTGSFMNIVTSIAVYGSIWCERGAMGHALPQPPL